ncbi:MAG: mandelate racemase/muconate lactonizing enzyme family protein, partial [Hyphomicrobiales bacterium]|nr:mandelate racemase/muconate lactonizing enzyme family protein [Hyphomicrobiales bacterium]
AGENICADTDYAAHFEAGALTYYQPDVAKWGGIGGCYSVGQAVVGSGRVYCPHFMGTAVGLAASLHLLAAVGGDGFVELDANDNPLRTALCTLDLTVTEGRVQVPGDDGIGVVPEPEALRHYQLH